MTKEVERRANGGHIIWARVGRLPKFESPSAFEKMCAKYFKETPFDQYSVTGLALYCGTSRKVLCDYENKPEFKDLVERAKAMIEHSYEMSLRKNGRTTDIFALKQFGWQDIVVSDNRHSGAIKTGINWIGSANIIQEQAINAITATVPKSLTEGEGDEEKTE